MQAVYCRVMSAPITISAEYLATVPDGYVCGVFGEIFVAVSPNGPALILNKEAAQWEETKQRVGPVYYSTGQ